MKLQLIIALTFITCLAIRCTKDDVDLKANEEILFSASIVDQQTGEKDLKFGGGNVVGICVTDYNKDGSSKILRDGDNHATNIKYRQSAEGLAADNPIKWGEVDKIDVYAYYPWMASLAPIEAVPFEIYARQDSLKNKLPGYSVSDFLWCKTTVDAYTNPVSLLFQHVLSQVVVNLKSDATIPGTLKNTKIKLLGHNLASSINLSNGEVKQIQPGVKGDIVTETLTQAKEGYEIATRAITIPQTVEAGVKMLEITTAAGKTYVYTMASSIDFVAGKSREIDIEIVSGELIVTVGDVTDWREDGNVVTGEATVAKSYKVGDLYNENGVKGFVYKVDEDGEHGMIVSLEESDWVAWAGERFETSMTSESDGKKNMEEALKMDPTLDKFPAFKWCNNFNKNGITGWYMPSRNELKELMEICASTVVAEEDPWWGTSYYFEFNDMMVEAGGKGFHRMYNYLSSTQRSNNSAWYFNINNSGEEIGEDGKPIFVFEYSGMKGNQEHVRAIYAF